MPETLPLADLLAVLRERGLPIGVREHLTVKRHLAELLDMDTVDEHFDDVMKKMQEALEHHIGEEETRLFKMLSDVSEQELNDIGRRMKDVWEQLIDEEPRYDVPTETGEPARL